MGRKVNYPPAAKINARELRNSLLKDARDLDFLTNLKNTSFSRSLVEAKEVFGLAQYYLPIKAVSDGGLIYMLMSNSDGDTAKNGIVVLDAYSLEVVATKYGQFDTTTMADIIVDENYLYVLGRKVGEIKLYRINKYTLQIVDYFSETTLTGVAAAICFGATWIYLACYTAAGPRAIRKINRATMILDSSWGSVDTTLDITSLAAVGTTLYAGINSSPGQVIKINAQTMATLLTWTGGVGVNKVRAIELDGSYIYAILSAPFLPIYKITVSTMVTAASDSVGVAPWNDMAVMSQTDLDVFVFYTDSGNSGWWYQTAKASMSSTFADEVTNSYEPRQMIAVDTWQYFIGIAFGNIYHVRKVMVGVNI